MFPELGFLPRVFKPYDTSAFVVELRKSSSSLLMLYLEHPATEESRFDTTNSLFRLMGVGMLILVIALIIMTIIITIRRALLSPIIKILVVVFNNIYSTIMHIAGPCSRMHTTLRPGAPASGFPNSEFP